MHTQALQGSCKFYSRVGLKKLFFEIQKKGFFNPGKSAKNIFQTDFGWLPVTTAV